VNRPATPEQPPASAAAVAGLAREVAGLRAIVGAVADLPGKVEHLAKTVSDAVDDLAGAGRKVDPVRPVSWLATPADAAELTQRLGELADWTGLVYLRYSPAARSFPDCWLWHSEVVEELAWLHLAWQTAYHPQTGTVAAAGDWHDRLRPGVVTRVRAAAGTCSLEVHLDASAPQLVAPSSEAVPAIAEWWATGRDQLPPAPAPESIQAAHARRANARGGRR
jgi:hypothetical protein